MIFNLLLALFLAYEIQKLFQLDFFFRLRNLALNYYQNFVTKTNSIAYKEQIKISLIDFSYMVTIFIGLFTNNLYFFCALMLLSSIQSIVFKITKSKTIRKYWYITDILISIILLILIIININFYHLDSIQFLKKIFNF